MARKILILADDDETLRQAAAALASPGVEVATERSAEAALGRLLGGEADLAVIDTGHARGLHVANELQRRWGAFPVVLLVPRERQDHLSEAENIVGRPIRADELRRAAERALGTELRDLVAVTPGPAFAPDAPAQGLLRERPVHVVLGELARRRSSGRLDLEGGNWRGRIHFADGMVIAGTANDARILAGYAEVAAGTLDRSRLEAAVAHVRTARVPLTEALRATGAMDEAALAAALARQAAAAVEQACALPDGTWSFASGAPPPPPPHARLHPLALASAGVRRAYPAPTIRAWLDRHRHERLAAHPELRATLAAAGIATTLPDRLDAPAGELLGRLSEPDLALLFTLAGFALLRFAPVQQGRGHGAAAPAVSPPETAPARTLAPLTSAEREGIVAEERRAASANHYEVLGIPQDADAEAIKQAFFAAARRWHTDAWAGRDLGELAPVVERIFARVSEAHAVLSNPAERAEYDVFLERKAAGLPTDVLAVLKAEELFHKAVKLFRSQRYAEAEALFRQAVDLNPAEAEFWAYLGASSYHARGSAAVMEAREAFARARSLIPWSLVTEYLEAQLEIGEGALDAAEQRLRKILLDKPDHREAAQQLRNLRERKEKESATGRGFFGTLWKRK